MDVIDLKLADYFLTYLKGNHHRLNGIRVLVFQEGNMHFELKFN